MSITAFDEFGPGCLVKIRNRPWVVLPSADKDLYLVKPLGGSDHEITGIYKPLARGSDIPETYDFNKPDVDDIGDFRSAKLLYHAARLSFRNAAGPFRSLAKLSFRPRSYQMVPLIMALKQDPVRLLIADDVGVGKTIEALLIARELMERKEIEHFAILCLPHLCDQWQEELKSKFGIEAAVIRSGTASLLEKQIRSHEIIFDAFPVQIISIDYIKSSHKLQTFIQHAPELIIVDEAHSCARPAGASNSQQLRFNLLHELSKKAERHLVFLTATPHSGKQEEFRSLLGLLQPEMEDIDLEHATKAEKEMVADHFIQRRRGDIIHLSRNDEETRFPKRLPIDLPYPLSKNYGDLFNDVLDYAWETIENAGNDKRKQRYSYWDVLALLRGVISSPAAGVMMLRKKAAKKQLLLTDDDFISTGEQAEKQIVLDSSESADDSLPLAVLGKTGSSESESKRLHVFADRLNTLIGSGEDTKAREALVQIRDWLKAGYSPVVFCRYIETAKYFGEQCRQFFTGKNYKSLQIEVITSELDDELRREKITAFSPDHPRLLIATDCLSEGINLQEGFNAVLHYDLPWNPNRMEQREGRVDRFGQQKTEVLVARLYGSNNPIDGIVLDTLIKKSDEIRNSIGISIPLPEDDATVVSALTEAVLFKRNMRVRNDGQQMTLFEDVTLDEIKTRINAAYDAAMAREKISRSVFSQKRYKIEELEADLAEVDEAIGDVKTVAEFVLDALRFIGVQVDAEKEGYRLYTTNIPARLLEFLQTDKSSLLITFLSPTPPGYKYLGRNHPFVEHLTQHIINDALNRKLHCAARADIFRTNDVKTKTVLFQFRVRNVIAEQPGNRLIVAEEMWLWGFSGEVQEKIFLDFDAARKLLQTATPSQNVEKDEQAYWLNEELKWVRNHKQFREITDPVAGERADHLVQTHARVRKLLRGQQYRVVEPILPMDVLGIYILLPELQEAQL